MKRLLIFLILLPVSLYSQEFSTNFIFKNGKGISDTIVVGYSPNATDSLDVSMGEKNIPDSQIDTNFFVYASDVIAFENGKFLKPKYRTKKQLLSTKSNTLPVCIDIICKDFPLTIKWDKLQFQDTSRSQSFIIPGPPGGWFDVGVGPLRLITKDSVVYSQQYISEWAHNYADSIHAKEVKVWKLYIGFANSKNNTGINTLENEKYKVFPNPCQNSLTILFANEKNVFFQLTDLAGKTLYSEHFKGTSTNIDMTDLQKGIYFLKVSENYNNYVYKILKY